jgi:hypothetical protein
MAVLVVSIAVLAACGAAAPTANQSPTTAAGMMPPTPSPMPSYLCQSVNMGTDGSWAIYWDSSAGVWYSSQREGSRIITANGSASLNGPTLSLSVSFSAWNYLNNSSLAPNLPQSGTYAMRPNSSGGLDLSVPFSEGSVRTYTFGTSTVDSYNAATQKMNDQIAAGQ